MNQRGGDSVVLEKEDDVSELSLTERQSRAMRTTRISFTLAALATFAAACSGNPNLSPAPDASTHHALRAQAIAVQVSNQNSNTMSIYLVRQGARYLVGQVYGIGDTTVTIPASLVPPDRQIRLRAEALAGGSTTTPLLIVPDGQRIYWTLGSDLSISTASAG